MTLIPRSVFVLFGLHGMWRAHQFQTRPQEVQGSCRKSSTLRFFSTCSPDMTRRTIMRGSLIP